MVRDRLEEFQRMMAAELNRDSSFKRSLRRGIKSVNACSFRKAKAQCAKGNEANEDFRHNDTTAKPQDSNAMEELLFQVSAIRKDLAKLAEMEGELSKIYSEIVSSPTPQTQQQLKANSLKSAAMTMISGIKLHISVIRNDGCNATDQTPSQSSSEKRMRETQCDCLSIELVNIIEKINITEVKYYEQCREKIVRQLDITGQNITHARVTNLLSKQNSQVFTPGISTEQQFASNSRRDEILGLEAKIIELNELFVNMADTIEVQGGCVNNIERHVSKTLDHVEVLDANIKRKQAKKCKRKRSKLLKILKIGGFVVLCIVSCGIALAVTCV
ncbi:unnamed protein product [Owenia fusiformis]|uniref:Uncharacterized protein n=1 Tax=Owenia fusiformis TaxID=6347 RepID=A0A8J1XLJ2_OWEFU|nr:unnamed protein product [Owenia fusiformis]